MAERTSPGTAATLSERVAQASRRRDGWAGASLSSVDSQRAGVQTLALDESQYPGHLRAIAFPPPFLYVVGRRLNSYLLPALAIVGSRTPSQTGRLNAFQIAAQIAKAGHAIVSGLARGIDTAAHEGALSVGGDTIAVLGTGVDRVYPSENQDLRDRIAQCGTLVSQFPMGQASSKTTFPARNAVIAGLSSASLVIEASERSGTRIELDLALEQDKPVLLWQPRLGDQMWARDLAQKHRLVTFVSTASDVMEAMMAPAT